jgi:hypothetical protein
MARRLSYLAMVLLLGGQPAARAQGIGGAIVGRVIDERGSAVPAALVQLVNTSTGQLRTLSTDEEGRYEARELSPGRYDLTILKGGFNTAKAPGISLGVTRLAQVSDIKLSVAPVGAEITDTQAVEVALVEASTSTLSTAFDQVQIRELPLLTRDANNLALLAPGVSSARTFSFASTLVPFSVNGSRERDNNFVIDSVDNNEPLFGGAATQFTNTDAFSEYRILTGQYRAEYGRNSGSIVNAITQRGGNAWHGSTFWFAQRDSLNAMNLVERASGLTAPAPFREDMIGATLGGPIRHNSTWAFVSYQWDGARQDLSPLYPQVATIPTLNGLNALSSITPTTTLNALLSDPTVRRLPLQTSPCVSFIKGLPAGNPCTTGNVSVSGTPVEFGTYLVPSAGIFDDRDHQFSARLDHKLTPRDDIAVRYLFDDLGTPRTAGSDPLQVGFFDPGLLPAYRESFAQRTQNAGVFWTHAWPRTLHELRGSFTRISSRLGALGVPETARETLPAVTISDAFAPGPGNFQAAFPASGAVFTLGLDSRPSRINSNLAQMQDNVSLTRGRHSLKFGANLLWAQSNIVDVPSDLGEYFFGFAAPGFQEFSNNTRDFAIQQIPNLGGRGGEELPLRVFEHFYFVEDDVRVKSNLTLNIGLRYENFGQPINRIADLNSNFGPKVKTDNFDFGPRAGFAWAIGTRTVVRGGYGIYYDPAVFNVALLMWQSGPISTLVAGTPSNVYPQPPFNPSDALRHVTDCDSLALTSDTTRPTFVDCSTQDSVARNLVQPRVQNYSLGVQHQFGDDWLVEADGVGSKGNKLFQRFQSNERAGWSIPGACPAPPAICAAYLPRVNPNRGVITTISNSARSDYDGLQLSATKRFTRAGFLRGLSLNASFAWSHMLDNASEIFGPGIVRARNFKAVRNNAATVEVITPFPQDSNDPVRGERGNSSFDHRHRTAVSFYWALPSPGAGAARISWNEKLLQLGLGGWGLSGIFSTQTGQPFSPLNSFGACTDPGGDGVLTTDRPSIGNPRARINSIALVADPQCINTALGYRDLSGQPIDPATAHFVQVPLGVSPGTTFRAGNESFVGGSAGRNSLIGPTIKDLDFAIFKDFKFNERLAFQLRLEGYDILNSRNPGVPNGNVSSTSIQSAPAVAFGGVASVPGSAFGGFSPSVTPARVTGVVPENTLDAFSNLTSQPLFLSRQFMNTSSRKIQVGVKMIF